MSTALQVDQIFNLACPASPPHYQYNTIKTLKTSFLGAINMLGLAKRCKVTAPSCCLSRAPSYTTEILQHCRD